MRDQQRGGGQLPPPYAVSSWAVNITPPVDALEIVEGSISALSPEVQGKASVPFVSRIP